MPKKLFVLHTRKTRPSARALARKLITYPEVRDNCTVERGTLEALTYKVRAGNSPDVVINIGCFSSLPAGYNGLVLNKPASIAHSSNKRKARITFEKEDIPAPQLWTTGAIPRDSYPLVGRTTNHSKGQGFWFCRNHFDAQRANRLGATHFIKFIEDTREFRVHVVSQTLGERTEADYASIKMSEKVFEGVHHGQQTDVMKNRVNGWVFKHPNEISAKLLANLRSVAKKAVATFDMEWGAVDIMADKDTGELYVLEINSSPRLTDQHANTVDKYADWILHLADVKKKNIKMVAKTAPRYVPPKQLALRKISKKDPDVRLVKDLFTRIGF